MVPTIIENEQAAGGAKCIKFSVYRSSIRPDVILANWQHGSQPAGPKAPAPIDGNRVMKPVNMAARGSGARRVLPTGAGPWLAALRPGQRSWSQRSPTLSARSSLTATNSSMIARSI
jgi:hypothetical protein